MILWINGAFGVGKTQTAAELRRRLKGAFLYDPENIGYFLRRNLPEALRDPDFQDTPLWREFNYRILSYLEEQYRGPVVVPMTIANRTYYDEILQRLIDDGVVLHHIILFAEKETILGRLEKRLESRTGWAVQQLDRCIYAFLNQIPGTILHTDRLTISQVVDHVGMLCNLSLAPDRRDILRRAADRLTTQLQNIR